MAAWNPVVNDIFLHAVELAEPTARATYLTQVCGDDAALRAQVEALLAAQANAGSFLEQPLVDRDQTAGYSLEDAPHIPWDAPTHQARAAAAVGTVIAGRYKLLQVIGEGGMGNVFLAEQQQPVKRHVAVKIIKAGMDSKSVLARFDVERQALALMDHPHIAKVFDAGTTAHGQPFFVMELVKGVPITLFCDERRLSISQRLQLFQQVCHAVQHAHQKGIIHRDLKPSNILVELHEGQPVPKIIDFGLAKAVHDLPLTEHTAFTQFGTIVGTPLYMAPEQAEASAIDIDTRADIYSLGVILYELLTGTTPLEKKRLAQAGWDEIRRVIKEEEPQTPSARLSTTAALPAISARRQSEPHKLGKLVRGDLDWIVMKALAKERDRRYATANAFAADISRFLQHEPVAAGPPTLGYQARKFIRRHRGPVIAVGMMAGLLALGIVGTALGLVWALDAEQQARQAATAEARQRHEAETQRDRARSAEKLATERLAQVTTEKERATRAQQRAQEQADIAKAVSSFLQLDLLAEAAPERNARAKKITMEEVLGRAAANISHKFAGQPRVEAAIRLTIGNVYRQLGDNAAAQPHLERSWELYRQEYGEEDPDSLRALHYVTSLYQGQGQYAKAQPLRLQELAARRRVLGEDHPDTLRSLACLASLYGARGRYAQAEPLFLQALDGHRRVLGAEHPDTLRTLHGLAALCQKQGRLTEAEPLLERARDGCRRVLGPEHLETLAVMHSLAELYEDQGHYAKAEALLQQTLEIRRRVQGAEHPNTIDTITSLGSLLQARGQYPQAASHFDQALETCRRVLGPEHPDTLRNLNNVANLRSIQGQYAQAEQLLEQARDGCRRVLGAEHPDTLTTMNNLALIYMAQRQWSRAEPLLLQVLESRRRVLGDEHSDTLNSMNNLATLRRAQGQLDQAEALLLQVLESRRRVQGVDHPATLGAMNNLGSFLWATKKLDRAIPLLEEALQRSQVKLGSDHPSTLLTMANLGVNYRDAGRGQAGVKLLEQAWDKTRQRPGPVPESLEWIPGALAGTYCRASQWAKAEPYYREALALTRVRHGQTPATARILSLLGETLLYQEKHAQAEEVFRECLAIRVQHQPEAWTTFMTRSLLGDALLGQRKYAEAEPLLLQGYEGLKKHAAMIPAMYWQRQPEAAERLVRLYVAWGKREEAAKFRQEWEMMNKKRKTPSVP